MGFGSDLKYSHEALVKLQDWELRLLETVKKFMAMRIKSDKEYASTLQNLCNQVDKESTSQLDYVSNVSKSWLLIVQQTEQLSKIMKTHAEDLNAGPLHRLTMMIKDKQQIKKSYIGVYQQIEAEMFKVSHSIIILIFLVCRTNLATEITHRCFVIKGIGGFLRECHLILSTFTGIE
uniref:F-BAR domain-containing protein n=1 Tax=Podarcis muralis TaxID=64176 RepID=A0A670J3B4_PODMU